MGGEGLRREDGGREPGEVGGGAAEEDALGQAAGGAVGEGEGGGGTEDGRVGEAEGYPYQESRC